MGWDRSNLKTPFYAVIFSYIRGEDLEGYLEMDDATIQEVSKNPGMLGYEVAGDGNRQIFISYWDNMESIEKWKENTLHKRAKSKGKQWYLAFHSLICKVEHHSSWHPEKLG